MADISSNEAKNSYLRLLSQCSLSIFDQEAFIACTTDHLFKAVYIRWFHIAKEISKISPIKCITIVNGDRKVSFPTNFGGEINFMAQPEHFSGRIVTVPDSELITEVLGFERSAYIIRFSDDRGLFSNEKIKFIRPNDWQGINIANYWVADELGRFKQDLMKDVELRDYSYIAYLFTGEKAKFTVDARLANYRGDLVRVVKNKSWEVLS